jgi:hypothetical protein
LQDRSNANRIRSAWQERRENDVGTYRCSTGPCRGNTSTCGIVHCSVLYRHILVQHGTGDIRQKRQLIYEVIQVLSKYCVFEFYTFTGHFFDLGKIREVRTRTGGNCLLNRLTMQYRSSQSHQLSGQY